MIFAKAVDSEYSRWFAWRPTTLYGPDEWMRMKLSGGYARTVWLRWVWRMRCRPRTYYALFDGDNGQGADKPNP